MFAKEGRRDGEPAREEREGSRVRRARGREESGARRKTRGERARGERGGHGGRVGRVRMDVRGRRGAESEVAGGRRSISYSSNIYFCTYICYKPKI